MRPWRWLGGWSGTAVLVLWAVAATLLVVFVAQNFVTVEVRLLRWEIDVRLAWAIVVATAGGFAVGAVAAKVISR